MTDYRLTRQETEVLEEVEQTFIYANGAYAAILSRLARRGFLLVNNHELAATYEITDEGLEALRIAHCGPGNNVTEPVGFGHGDR